MGKDYPEITKRISNSMKNLRKDITDTMQGFSSLAQAATQNGALDKKTKELIALGFIQKHLLSLVSLERSLKKY
jgi:alkylhydroperoxidase/carboxymuconolactone decarboxylase family protein YurZ